MSPPVQDLAPAELSRRSAAGRYGRLVGDIGVALDDVDLPGLVTRPAGAIDPGAIVAELDRRVRLLAPRLAAC